MTDPKYEEECLSLNSLLKLKCLRTPFEEDVVNCVLQNKEDGSLQLENLLITPYFWRMLILTNAIKMCSLSN